MSNHKIGTEPDRGLTRREFIKTSIAGAATAATLVSGYPAFARRAHAAGRDHILVGFCNPSTGPLAAIPRPGWSSRRDQAGRSG